MEHRKNRNLHVVKDTEEQTEKLVRKIVKELNSENSEKIEDLEEQVRKQRKKHRRKVLLGCITAAAVIAAIFIFIQLQTYSSVRVFDTYSFEGAADSNYRQFAGRVLKYSRDGISYLDQNGEEQWNQAYQIKNPFVVVNDVSGAVADKGGNDIIVFQKDGVKGEIHTSLPIENISLSEQGIVCAVLKENTTPRIVCYDAAGNILVEHKASFTGAGYPVSVSISPDGEVMQTVYLSVEDGRITGKTAYYNFGEAGEDKTDRQVSEHEYDGTVMASGFFLDQNTSAVVGDNCMVIYKGNDVPEEDTKITIEKEIKSVFHSDKYIGLVLRNEGKGGYELRLYNKSGKNVLSQEFTGDYNNIKMCGSQVIMYDGKQCSVFLKNGIQKFQGEMQNNILEIFPVAGVNKYIVMNANGMELVRFVK